MRNSGGIEAVAGTVSRSGTVSGDSSVAAALASLGLCMLLPSLGTSIANVALPTLVEAFGASFQQVQWIVLAYLLATTTSIVSVGRLGDLVGRRRLLMVGVALFTAASGLGGAATELWLVIAARAAQGLAAAVMMALTMAFVGDAVPKARSGSAMGLLGTMSAAGTALGPSIGGGLIAALGWQAIFFINIPLGILALLLVWRHLPADPRTSKGTRAAFDTVGTLVLALTLAAYALAMTVGHGSFGLVNLGLLAAAALGVKFFIKAESVATSPLIRLAEFRDPELSAGIAMSGLVSSVMMATLVVGPFYLAGALGLETALVGIVMSVGPVVAALAGVPAGRLVDRLGARRLTVAGLAAMVSGSSALAILPVTLGIAGYVIPIAITTAGYALFQAANNSAVLAGASADRRGVIAGVLNLSRNLGLVTGASVMGAIFAFASHTGAFAPAPAEAVAVGLRVTFAVGAAVAGIALGIALCSGALSRLVPRTGSTSG